MTGGKCTRRKQKPRLTKKRKNRPKMKKHKYFTVFSLAVLIAASGCKKQYDQYTPNTNLPSSVPAYLILRQVLNDMAIFPGGNADKFCQYTLSSYTYYGDNQYWTGSADLNYGTLRNIVAMENEAKKASGEIIPIVLLLNF